MISCTIHIESGTNGELSARELAVLTALSGVPSATIEVSSDPDIMATAMSRNGMGAPSRVTESTGDETRAELKKEVAKTTATAKKAAAPKPAPVAEEPVAEEEPEAAPDEAPDAETATLEDAVKLASATMAKGESAQVKAVLTGLGVKRVSELKGGQIGEFIANLTDLVGA